MSVDAAACTRVYASHGKVAHLLGPDDSPNAERPAALCGMRPRLFAAWLGTGSQREHECAGSLPLCEQCKRITGGETADTTSKGAALWRRSGTRTKRATG